MPRRHASLRQYPEAKHQVLEGRYAGHVNFSHLPELPLRKGLRGFSEYGTGLGAIMLPLQPGAVYEDSDDERRRALNINVFRDKQSYEPGAYLLVPDSVLERPGRHRPYQGMHGGVVSLVDGDVFPVGKDHWLPMVGYDVDRLRESPRLAQLYKGVHGDQGAFHVRNDELIWIDSGHKNRSILIQTPDALSQSQAAEQGFVPTERLDMARLAASGIRSVFDAPPPLPADLHDATGR